MTDPRVKALCDEFEIEIIPGNRYPLPGQTRAVASIRRLIDHHGEDHARLVLCILAEGQGNQGLIDEYSLNAISSVLRACPDVMEKSASAVLELFDRIPLGPYMVVANELRGTVHQGNALAGIPSPGWRPAPTGSGRRRRARPRRAERCPLRRDPVSEAVQGPPARNGPWKAYTCPLGPHDFAGGSKTPRESLAAAGDRSRAS